MEIADLKFKRIKLSSQATNSLRRIKNRINITPNIACRLALILSLKEDTIDYELFNNHDGMEINRYTLLGEYESSLLALFLIWCEKQNITSNFYEYFIAHLNRGALSLSNRV